MRVLLIAPEPFYQERGTPIAVDMLLRILSKRGDQVDILTYHEGRDVSYPGVRQFRIAPPPFVRKVPPGPSWKKIVCDAFVFFRMLGLCRRTRYDVVHAVEESVFMAYILYRWKGVPYLYDMDSLLSRQIGDRFPVIRRGLWPFVQLETLAISGALAVLPVCEELGEEAGRRGARRITVLTDFSLLADERPNDMDTPHLLPADWPTGPMRFLYVGNLEPYQGIDLLLDSFAKVSRRLPDARLIVVGGSTEHVQGLQRRIDALGLASCVLLTGPQPVQRLGELCRNAEVLVSPRTHGNNTPMKIYSYLDSGCAIVATDLPMHRQVLNDDVALLAAPLPDAFADALFRAASDSGLRAKLGEQGRALTRSRYSRQVFEHRLDELYAWVEAAIAPASDA